MTQRYSTKLQLSFKVQIQVQQISEINCYQIGIREDDDETELLFICLVPCLVFVQISQILWPRSCSTSKLQTKSDFNCRIFVVPSQQLAIFCHYYQQFLVLTKTAQFNCRYMIWPHISHTFQLPSTQIVSKYVLPIMISTYPSLSKYSSSMVKLSKMCYTWIDHLLFLRYDDFVRCNEKNNQ